MSDEDHLFLFCSVDEINELLEDAGRYSMGPYKLVKTEMLANEEMMVHLEFEYNYPYRDTQLKEKWARKKR